ncbi:UvrD-helicase domain-containing protein [Pseudofrankia sp. BMG5.36]|uniref:UvrD-helicase domain-containing protein n=1 Tax=Pseudofrankia sp. BMG5.36 TaxID=1834512 RepID=UPI0008DA9EA5|nr:UvrD-helicase domain-containing protein [Pseudofrankia sp. BMG5.36]OHV66836.1 DNA helicase UvrD [Pseudofrankia sp. BMG5.36]
MASLGFAQSFFKRLPDLPKEVQKRIPELLGKFQESTIAGLHLEKPHAIADERGRTIRVTKFWRGVVMAPTEGDHYILFDILEHDKAYAWLTNHTFAINSATQDVEIVDISAMQAAAAALPIVGPQPSPGTFDAFADAVLLELGVEENYLPLVRRVRSDADLDLLTRAMPASQHQVLEMLAAGFTVREVRSDLGIRTGSASGATSSMTPSAGLLASPTVFVPKGAKELQEALDHPLELWRIFLHPSQRRISYREKYSGPVRVTGGAGTGKTVVALHRAHHLARQLPVRPRRPVLVTTFVRTLADDLRANLASLDSVTGVDTGTSIEVTTVDALAHRIVTDAEGVAPKLIVGDELLMKLWTTAAAATGSPFTPAVLRQEWESVVLAKGVRALADYLSVSRAGRAQPLTKPQRVQVWAAIEHFLGLMRESGERTFYQLADDAARYARAMPVGDLFPHVVVDEAQDLHPAQWRLLRAVVPDGPDDLFIVGDAHQRIYDHRVALTTMGINVRGRSHRLRLNYRTSEEILTWAIALLSGQVVDDLDAGVDSLDGYRSAFHGAQPPTMRGYPTPAAELDGLVATVGGWLDGGVASAAIGIAARTRKTADAAVEALQAVGIECSPLDRKKRGGVEIGTMHRMKGLEYRAMAVIDVSARSMPLPYVVTPKADDPTTHAQDTLRELCLLYVACTRAREFLSVSWPGAQSPFLQTLGD